jgi:hypothetical protein
MTPKDARKLLRKPVFGDDEHLHARKIVERADNEAVKPKAKEPQPERGLWDTEEPGRK